MCVVGFCYRMGGEHPKLYICNLVNRIYFKMNGKTKIELWRETRHKYVIKLPTFNMWGVLLVHPTPCLKIPLFSPLHHFLIVCNTTSGWVWWVRLTARMDGLLLAGRGNFYRQDGWIFTARKGEFVPPGRVEVDWMDVTCQEWQRLTERRGGSWPRWRFFARRWGWMLTTRRGEGCPPCKKTGGRWPLGVVGRGCAECGVWSAWISVLKML